jgi:putative effector of murein hydrolase
MLNKNKFIALQYKSKLAIGIATHGIGASRAFSIHPGEGVYARV